MPNGAAPAPCRSLRLRAAQSLRDPCGLKQIVGFKKIKFYALENVGAGKLSMPEQEMHTTSFWLHFPGEFLAGFKELSAAQIQAGLSGLGNALRSVAALLVMCDPRDLGVALGSETPSGIFEPNLYIYDN